MAITGHKRDGEVLDDGGYDEDFPQFKKPRNELIVAEDTTARERKMAVAVSIRCNSHGGEFRS